MRPVWEEGWEGGCVVQVLSEGQTLESLIESQELLFYTWEQAEPGLLLGFLLQAAIVLGAWLQRWPFMAPNFQFLGKKKCFVKSLSQATVVARRPGPVGKSPLPLLLGSVLRERSVGQPPSGFCYTGVERLCLDAALSLVGKVFSGSE